MGCQRAAMVCRLERSAATRSRCHAMPFARRRAAATLVRAALAAESRGPAPAQAVVCLDLVVVREQAAGFPARAAEVWAKAVRPAGRGLASPAKGIARTSIGPAHFRRGRVGKAHSLA